MASKLEEMISKIKSGYIVPRDLRKESVILGKTTVPHFLTPITGGERASYEDRKLCLDTQRQFGRSGAPESILWDDSGVRGRFDKCGRVIVDRAPPQWLVMDASGSVLGPFSRSAMRRMIGEKRLTGCLVKREGDAHFVSYEQLSKARANFLVADLDDVFESARKEFEVIASCSRAATLLRKKGVKLDVVHVIGLVKGLSKRRCVSRIAAITGMSARDSSMFLDCLIHESKLPICSDVDEDGFES